MGLFGSNYGGAALSYDEQLRQQMLRQQGAMTTPGIGEGVPSGDAPSRGGLFSSAPPPPAPNGQPGAQRGEVAPINEMDGIRRAMTANARREPPAPSYADHHTMHGRDEHGGFAKKKRSTGEKILKGIGDFALHWSAGQGDPIALMRLKQMMADKSDRAKAQSEYQEHHGLVQNLMRRGISAEDAELYALNPEKLSEEMVSRFRTRDVAPEHSIRTPGLGNGPDSTWTAPDIVEDGPNRVQVDPNTGVNRTLYTGKTKEGWAADEAGFEPGTQAYQRFMQDIHLDGQGPTAVDMNNSRISNSAEMNRLRIEAQNMRHGKPRQPRQPSPKAPTPSSVIGRIMDKQASGAPLTPAEQQTLQEHRAPRGRGRSAAPGRAASAVGPDGRRIVVRNGKWVDAQTGRPVQ